MLRKICSIEFLKKDFMQILKANAKTYANFKKLSPKESGVILR